LQPAGRRCQVAKNLNSKWPQTWFQVAIGCEQVSDGMAGVHERIGTDASSTEPRLLWTQQDHAAGKGYPRTHFLNGGQDTATAASDPANE